MNKRLLALLLTAAVSAGCAGAALAEEEEKKPYKAASAWAEEALAFAETLSVYPECFSDADLTVNVTRAEFAEISVGVYKALTGEEAKGGQSPFIDTENSFVAAAYSLGIIKGVSDTNFAPFDELTREAAATMLARTYSISVTDAPQKSAEEKFSDDSDISDWAYDDVYQMSALGYIRGTDKGFLPASYCTREQALTIAARMVSDAKGMGSIDSEAEPSKKQDYVIAYIGGSLTEGGANWQMRVTTYMKEQLPDKNIVTYNAGIGGTGSAYGALRYGENVMSKSPDLVFIDAAVNDAQGGNVTDELPHQKYMESMVRESLAAEKVPAIVFIYMPQPADKTDSVYKGARFSADAKEKLAQHYGISSVYIDEYLFKEYNEEGGGKKYTEWLGKYYNASGTGYDVHPKGAGYSMYGDAIVAELKNIGLENFTKPVEDKGIFCITEKSLLGTSYAYIKVGDERVTEEGSWKEYKSAADATGENAPKEKYYAYPFFEEGIWHTTQKGASISFKSSAQQITLSFISHTEGNTAVIYVDGKKAGEADTTSVYNNMNYTKTVEISKDKKEHEIKIEARDFGTPLDIGAVIEGFAD